MTNVIQPFHLLVIVLAGWLRPSSVDRTGRAIVLMPGPYDSRGKKPTKSKGTMFLVATPGIVDSYPDPCGIIAGRLTSPRNFGEK